MFHMQQQSNSKTTDELFGLAVARGRQAQGLSQREFAAALEREGMNVDASAVSRIEKGTRSVRLVEAAAIASALGVSLGALVREPQKDPSAQLRSYRKEANSSLRKLGNELWPAMLDIWQVLDHLEMHPELLSEIEGEPANVMEYLAGVTSRLDLWPVSEEEVVAFRDDQLPSVEAFMAKFVRAYLGRVVVDTESDRLKSERILDADYSDGWNEDPA